MHKREIIASPGSILLKDYITGLHKCISRLHLGPECEVIQSSEKACIIDDSISIETSVPLKIVDWKIASEFGIMQKSKCIEIPFSTDDTNIVTIQISIN